MASVKHIGEAMELEKEIRRYSGLNGYPIDSFEPLTCRCGGRTFRLFSDDEEGGAFGLCTDCGGELDIEGSKTYIEESVQNICNCDNDRLHLGVGRSFYPGSQDVRWVYVGAQCSQCNLVGVYVDWKES